MTLCDEGNSKRGYNLTRLFCNMKNTNVKHNPKKIITLGHCAFLRFTNFDDLNS